jgi:hypothetical protein
LELIERTYRLLGNQSYKDIYSQVVNTFLRVRCPVFEKEGHVSLGEPYILTFNEPKYRLMMNDVMKYHTIDERRNGSLIRTGEAVFIHGNRMPLERSQPAVLVKVVQFQMDADGTNVVTVLPFQHVWLETVAYHPKSFGLIHAQCLKMGKKPSNIMNHLARQEALAQVMDNMTQSFAAVPATDTSQDDDSFLSNQFEVTDDENDGEIDSISSSDSSEEDSADEDDDALSIISTDEDDEVLSIISTDEGDEVLSIISSDSE